MCLYWLVPIPYAGTSAWRERDLLHYPCVAARSERDVENQDLQFVKNDQYLLL